MKLVETDIALGIDDAPEAARPPRPEHRRVYVSLFLTASVLIATVAIIYVVFPKRDNQLLETALAEHDAPGAWELEHPGAAEVNAYALGVLGHPVALPTLPADGSVVGVRRLDVLRQPALLLRYQLGDGPVTMLVSPARDAPPRTFRRSEGALEAVSWRHGRWTFVVVGSQASADRWAPVFGVP
jgi:anti-sigma factor RsiW